MKKNFKKFLYKKKIIGYKNLPNKKQIIFHALRKLKIKKDFKETFKS